MLAISSPAAAHNQRANPSSARENLHHYLFREDVQINSAVPLSGAGVKKVIYAASSY